jgi:hypothetical protein
MKVLAVLRTVAASVVAHALFIAVLACAEFAYAKLQCVVMFPVSPKPVGKFNN